MKITPTQRTKIKIAQKELDIDDVAYRQLIGNLFAGKTSCTQLTQPQADALIAEFTGKGWKPKPSKKSPGKRRRAGTIAIVTPGQRARISAEAAKISWRFDDGPTRWMRSRFKFDYPRTTAQAVKVIEALKAMAARETP
jgi:phage gp16-like protein